MGPVEPPGTHTPRTHIRTHIQTHAHTHTQKSRCGLDISNRFRSGSGDKQIRADLSKGRFLLSPLLTQSSSCFWVRPLGGDTHRWRRAGRFHTCIQKYINAILEMNVGLNEGVGEKREGERDRQREERVGSWEERESVGNKIGRASCRERV